MAGDSALSEWGRGEPHGRDGLPLPLWLLGNDRAAASQAPIPS